MLNMPIELVGLAKRGTDGQATAAWGETDPVVLRCGVEPPAPTTDPCVTADDGTTAVDWVAVEGVLEGDSTAAWTFTTYGRNPAVQVVVPAAVTANRSTSFLIDLGPAVAKVEQTRACL